MESGYKVIAYRLLKPFHTISNIRLSMAQIYFYIYKLVSRLFQILYYGLKLFAKLLYIWDVLNSKSVDKRQYDH